MAQSLVINVIWLPVSNITVYWSPDGSRITWAGTITGEQVFIEAADTHPAEMGRGLLTVLEIRG